MSVAAVIKEEMKGLEKVTTRLRSNYYRVARNLHQMRESCFSKNILYFSFFSFFFVSNHFFWIMSISTILSFIFLIFFFFIFTWQAFSRKDGYLSIFYDVCFLLLLLLFLTPIHLLENDKI